MSTTRTADEQDRIESAKMQLATAVAGAQESLEQLIDWIRCFVDIEGGAEELAAELAHLLETHARESATWPADGINDRLDAAFAELDEIGIVALHHAASTLSSGWSCVLDAAADRQPPPRGATFYHGQDIESALEGHGLCLAFGSLDDDAGDDASEAIAREVMAMLEKHRIPATWNGFAASRIEVLPFSWRRRRSDRIGTPSVDELMRLIVPPPPPPLDYCETCGPEAPLVDDLAEDGTPTMYRVCERCARLFERT